MKIPFSLIALYISILFMLSISFFFYPKWEKGGTEATLSWDVSGYYFYLPAFFIYNDYTDLKWKDSILYNYQPTYDAQQVFQHSSGNYVIKYSLGQSILMSPFFMIGHTWAKCSGEPVDGFSMPYQKSIGIGMLVYMVVGLVLFRRVLLLLFADKVVALTLLALVFGSNYLNYAAIEQAQTHSTLFFLYSLLILLSDKYYKNPSIIRAVFIGLIIGLMTLIRPTEILSLLIPILWGLSNWNDLKTRFFFILKQYHHLLLLGISIFLVVSLQLIYWHSVTGDWIVYSYQDQGFNWLNPSLIDYNFSARSGWLRYCPMLFLFFIGLPFALRKKNIRFLVPVFGLMFWYIVCAWDIWWFGGRAMIQSYPILFLGIASLLHVVLKRSLWIRGPFFLLVGLFIYLNLWWTYHAHAGKIQVTETSDAYWRKTVGRFKSEPSDLYLIDNRHQYNGQIETKSIIFRQQFTQDQDSSKDEFNKFVRLGKKNTLRIEKRLDNSLETRAGYVRFEAFVQLEQKEYDTWHMPIIRLNYKSKKDDHQFGAEYRINRALEINERKRIRLDFPVHLEADSIIFSIENSASEQPIRVYNMSAFYYDKIN